MGQEMNWHQETHYNLISHDGEFRVSRTYHNGGAAYTLWRRNANRERYALPWKRIESFPNAEEAKQAAEDIFNNELVEERK